MEQKKMRCHISIIFENAGKFLGALIVIAFSQANALAKHFSDLNEIAGKTYLIGFFAFSILFLIVLVFQLLRWYKTTIWLEDGTIIVEQNTLNKKKNTYTIKHISNIDMEQNLFERLVGTYKLKIDTNSAALANSTDIRIVFSKQKANAFKQEIMTLLGEQEEANLMESENREDFDIVYSVKDILLHCFYTVNIFSFLFLIGGVVGFFILTHLADKTYTFTDFIQDSIGGFLAVFIMMVSSAYSMVKGYFDFYGFQAKRTGGRIYLSYGLFRKNIHTIPVSKINGIKVSQPIVSRIFGRYQVEVINVGTGDEKKESAYLLLSCTKEEVGRYMKTLLPEFENFIDKPIEKQSPKYFVHMLYTLSYFLLFLLVAILTLNSLTSEIPLWLEGTVAGGITCIVLLCYLISYFASGYFIAPEYLIVVGGIFTKTYSMIRYEKIQHIKINRTPASKITKLSNATIFILAAMKNSVNSFPFVTDEVLEGITQKMIKTS